MTFITPDTSPSRGHRSSLYLAALECRERGWSVIPLIGGSAADLGKRAAVPWTLYQQRGPDGETLEKWFVDDARSAYGIVCGAVSRLVVVDLDEADAETAFVQAFPQALTTFHVQSGLRKTSHFYFHVDFRVKTQKLRGGDLKAEGSYVVGPGSCIAGGQWEIINDSQPLTLSEADFRRLLTLLALPPVFPISPTDEGVSVGITCQGDFAAHYRRDAVNSGQRNTTLFKVACGMRDHGYPQQRVVTALADVHALQPPLGGQRPEAYEHRYVEALRTIASVYSRPPRQHTPSCNNADADATSTLSNSVREALLKLPHGAAFLRTYEGLSLAGFCGGQVIARPSVFATLKERVGEHSIKLALKAHAPNGEPLLVELPSPRPPTPADADTRVEFLQDNKCFVERQQPPESQTEAELTDEVRPAHRPCKYYRLPTEAELCAKLGVEMSMRDPIQRDDLASAKRYRQALERELIRRRPGQYPQGWLADRLGVTERSIRTYHRDIPIQAAARFISEQVTWENYQQMLPSAVIAKRSGIDIRGRFLEDETGKGYPAKEGVAQRLLGLKQLVWLKQRTYSEYWYGDSPITQVGGSRGDSGAQLDREARELEAKARLEEKLRQGDARVQAYFAQRHMTRESVVEIGETANETASAREAKTSELVPLYATVVDPKATMEQAPKRRKRGYGHSLEDRQAEQLAQQIHTATSERCYQAMSLRNARRLVETYGVSAVEAAFKKMVWLQERSRIADPAGFIVVASRVSWRVQQGQTEIGMRALYFEAEKGRKRRIPDPKEALAWRCLREFVLVTSDEYCLWRAGWELEHGDWMEAGFWLSRAEVEFPW